MNISPVVAHDVDDLIFLVHLDDTDLLGVLQSLENTAELAVPSLLGWKLSFTIQGQPLRLTSIHPCVDTGRVRASLHVPLSRVLNPIAGAGVTFYAAQPGAFTALAADLAALHLTSEPLCLDEDLAPNLTPGLTGLPELSAINQAIGVLIAGGSPTASAQAQVDRQEAVIDLNAHRFRRNPVKKTR